MTTPVNAVIESTFLGIEHGNLTATITVRFDGSPQNFGGYNLKSSANGATHSEAYIFLSGVLRVAGVSSWEELEGQYVRIRHGAHGEAGPIVAIGHITEDRWFEAEKEMGS